jgi:hypothetical protein
MFMSRHHNACKYHNIQMATEFFTYMAKLTNQNGIHKEFKRRLNLENACYYSFQNIYSSRLLSKNINIKIRETKSWLLFLMDVKVSLSHSRNNMD